MVEVMGVRELPIGSATSCCAKEINKLEVDVMIKPLHAEESTKGEDV